MADPYLYADTPVLKNKLDIRDEKVLDLVEAEQSRANMMLLYERGFSDFTPAGLCEIHRFLFGDIYDWAGEYRIINIEKREKLLAGRSVWYSNDEDIPRDLENAFQELLSQDWRQHNYVACCGTSSLPVLWMLEHNPVLRDVCLCLDNDKAGHTASLRLAEQIAEQFEIASSRLISENKDWNDDLTELAERDHAVQRVQQIG